MDIDLQTMAQGIAFVVALYALWLALLRDCV